MAQLIKNWEVCMKASCHASIKLVNMDVDIIYHRFNIRNDVQSCLEGTD